MSRKHVPDLDLLESPLISANPFGSILGRVPGSALAERIFNDPDSWDAVDDDDDDLGDTKEAMAWLQDEVEKYHANGDELGLSPIDRDMDIMLKPFSERFNLVATPGSEKQVNWKGVVQEDQPLFLPLFDHKSLDLSLNVDLRLSKIWDSKGKMFQSATSPLSPMTEPSAVNNAIPILGSDNTRLVVPPALDLASVDKAPSPIVSPVAVASASTTWSILEWYGLPNTPRMSGRGPLLSHFPSTPFPSIPPVPPIPPSTYGTLSSTCANATVVSQPPPLSSPPRKATPPAPESTPLRRLPVIPDPPRNTPSPTPTPTATPPPPQVKTPQRTPRGSATLPPPPTSSASDPFYLSPNSTPVRSGTLPSRSPPAGPRPRSSGARQGCGRDSPLPITIAPAPTPTRTRTRRPTPSPSLRLGVPA